MGYRSPFDQWDEKAAVRTMPATDRRWAPDAEGSWFGAESWSAANHPEVLASGRRQQVLAALLLGYLDFTLQLETHHIAPVSRDLVLRRLGADYADAVVRDALRVQCDEAFHGLFCEELAAHVAQVTGLQREPFPEHLFFRRVRELAAPACGPMSAPQYQFCVAVVAETVITDSLRKDWRGEDLRPEVRHVLLQHYKDEARHSTFFSQVLQLVWPQWPERVRAAMSPLWAELVRAFLAVDEALVARALELAGFSPAQARRIVAGTADGGTPGERGASISLTLKALRRAGVLRAAGPAAGAGERRPELAEVSR
ncbi:MAG TPA: diiron oxygenase [Myxococcaceae bacterium]|nr:diiron oxygenase [Myxococcaceae bacterium]